MKPAVRTAIDELRREADEHQELRRQLLTAYVAVQSAPSLPAAAKAVREHPHLPDDLKARVAQIIENIAAASRD